MTDNTSGGADSPRPGLPVTRLPLIGITGRRKKAVEVDGFPVGVADLDLDLFMADYQRDVLAAGGLPFPLPLDGEPGDYLAHLDGILLTGGADVEPDRYGDAPDGAGAYEPIRDEVELAYLDGALAAELPVLGICRGLQVINIAAGGTLNQDVPEHACWDDDPDVAVHRVAFEKQSRLNLLYGDSAEVNSLHHQTVDQVGDGIAVTGRAPDGVVEGIEIPGRDVLAVQWHPEMRRELEPVFGWLIKRAGARVHQ
ncbi:MAG: gamma-glutamyl-gamma-aminobutyrate hydrolase family protein [Acidimicrobiales bacterium]